ncbi:MAG TPA: nitrous oxide reductase, partial [Gemmatimonadaceae bacterium]
MKNPLSPKALLLSAAAALVAVGAFYSCTTTSGGNQNVLVGDAASKVYVAPGKYDEFYAFFSGGYNGQIMVYGLPSGRLLKFVPVFSQNPETGYGYNEETKPMLQTTYGFTPWDDAHHTELSQTDGVPDGRWLFINGNNTPRVA